MNQNHLSAAEVAMFREETLSSRSIEIGRHLLTCRECRTKLPAVTAQEFRNCLVDPEIVVSHSSKSRSNPFHLFPRFSVARATAFGGLVILLLAGLYLVRVRSEFPNSKPMIAKGDTTTIQSDPDLPESRSLANPRSDEPSEPISKELAKKDRDSKSEQVPKRIILGNDSSSSGKVPAIRTAETRGNENPCSAGSTLSLESNTNGKEIFLKWNPVKGATSYDIYISDLDENLIDHFESDSQTQYRSDVKLEPEKTYRWKLIITLRNGNKIVGPPQVLKPGLMLDNEMKKGATEKQRTIFAVRCVESR